MLDLDSPRWSTLTHAYGAADDIPTLIKQLPTAPAPDDWQAEPWYSLWSALCHQFDVYIASYAAVPHLAVVAKELPNIARMECIHLIVSIEAFRHRKTAPAIPPDLETGYQQGLKQTARLILECLPLDWDEDEYRILLGGLAIVKGQPRLGNGIMELSGEYECPACNKSVLAYGYDLFENGRIGS